MAAKIYARSMDGLIDACFDQLQDLRDGISNANETIAFAKAAEMIVRGVEADLKRKALQYAHDQRMLELNNRKLELTYDKNQEATEATDGGADQMAQGCTTAQIGGSGTCNADEEIRSGSSSHKKTVELYPELREIDDE